MKKNVTLTPSVLLSSLAVASTLGAAEVVPSLNAARFSLVAGNGYSVCEAYLKHLNAQPAEAPPPLCRVALSPQFKNFREPRWEALDWKTHLDWLYEMENILPPRGVEKPAFEPWKSDYMSRVDRGELAPRLRKADVVLNSKGVETVIGYDRNPGQCEVSQQKYFQGRGGSYYFVLIDGTPQKFDDIGGKYGTRAESHLLIYGGRARFIHVSDGKPFPWEMNLATTHHLLPDASRSIGYVMAETNICRYCLSANGKPYSPQDSCNVPVRPSKQ